MKTSFKLGLSPLVFALLLAGCVSPQSEKNAKTGVESGLADIDQARGKLLDTIANSRETRSRDEDVDAPYLAGKPVALSRTETIPEALRKNVDITTGIGKPGESVSLSVGAQRLTMATSIPVVISDDVYLPRSALMPLTEKGNSGATTRTTAVRGGGPLPFPGVDPVSTEDNLQVEMPRGPQELATTLNSWTTLHHINWSFDQQRGEIKIFRLVTKTWQLPVKPSPINYTSDFKGPTEQSNNSNSLQITTDSPPVKNEAASGLLELDAISNQVKTVMTQSGSISGNPVMGTLTLTDTADSVERAERIVQENAGILNKQVVLRVRMVQVTTSVDNELSFDWSTVLSKAFRNVSGFSLTTASPLTLAPSTAGAIGVSFTSGSLNGTQAVINALKDVGNVSTSNEIPLSIQNRHSSYYNVRTRFSYVASTTPASSVVGGTGGVPGITTAQDQVGLKMMLYPSVGQNNTVDLTVSIDNSVLQSLQSFTSGSGSNQQTVQLPNITGEGAVTDAIVHNGGTVVLTAFDRDTSTYDKRTLGDYLPVFLGGSKSAQHARTATLIILSAVVQDMGS